LQKRSFGEGKSVPLLIYRQFLEANLKGYG